MVITTSRPKDATGNRATRYSLRNDLHDAVALCSFDNMQDAALVARFLSGGNLPDSLAEKALELLKGVDTHDGE